MLKNFEKFTQQNLTYLFADGTQHQMITNVLEQVKSKYSHLVGLLEHRTKLLNCCLNYYKYVSNVRFINIYLNIYF